MKCVVITGSARGLGFEMAKNFRKNNYNVVISDIFMDDVELAKEELLKIKSSGDVLGLVCDVTRWSDVNNLIVKAKKKFNVIDIWINNAGVNQPNKLIWNLRDSEIDRMLEVDLKSVIVASKLIAEEMIKNNHGAIYNVEGHGSNNAIIPGLSIYGTAKRAITYFTMALAKELEASQKDILVGRLAPGIMITDFLTNSFRDELIEFSEKDKKIYNILGDYPDVVAKYLVNKMINNTDNNVQFNWLNNRRVIFKFLKSIIIKRDVFENKK